MNYSFHPEASDEYAEQVAFYKSRSQKLGTRFHNAVKTTIENVCQSPSRYRIEAFPNIRRVAIAEFPYHLIFRETNEEIQILAVAHNRRRPMYWFTRLQ